MGQFSWRMDSEIERWEGWALSLQEASVAFFNHKKSSLRKKRKKNELLTSDIQPHLHAAWEMKEKDECGWCPGDLIFLT